MKTLEKLILATLKYHNFFSFPLTLAEINKYQLAGLGPEFKRNKRPISPKKLTAILDKLKKEKKIGFTQGLYFLKGNRQLLTLRKKRQQFSREKIKIAQKAARIFSFIPWVKAVAVTGALAMKNSSQNDDIDLMVISQKNRLWLVRLLLLLIVQLWGKRRKFGQKEVRDKICLNLFLDELSLSLSQKKRNLFTAHEISQAKPILNKDNIWEKFLSLNLWLLNYLPNSLKAEKLEITVKNNQPKKAKTGFVIFSYLNKIAFWLQYQQMKKKITNELIGENYAFFHPQDRSKINNINSNNLSIL